MMGHTAIEMHAVVESALPFSNLLPCRTAQAQYSDLFSRLGFSDPADSTIVGIGQAHLASQREGKTFLEPFIAFSVYDETGENWLFEKTTDPLKRTFTWYPWGCDLEQTEGDVHIQMNAVFADMDVVALRLRVRNAGKDTRRLRLRGRSQAVASDTDVVSRSIAGSNIFLLEQNSKPSSRMQIRREPLFRIYTAFRPLFGIEPVLQQGCFAFSSAPFELASGRALSFDLYVTAASCDFTASGQIDENVENRTLALMQARLNECRAGVAVEIDRAVSRWSVLLEKFPVEDVEPEYRPLLYQAAVVLMENSIRPQPAQQYGGEMGGHLGTFPARSGYEAFWIWDSAIHVWGLRHFHPKLARENIRIMLHNQQNDGGLCMLHPDSKCPSTQPPLFADAAMRIYAVERDKNPVSALAFLEEVYPRLRHWNEWFFSACDPDGNGLTSWPDNLASGWDDSPRWDTDIPAGPRQNHGAAQYEAVDLNSFLVVDLRRLAEMAELLHRPEEAAHLRVRANQLAALIVEHLYCPEDNLFYDLHRETGRWNRIKTPACFMPLWAGVPLDEIKIRSMLQDVLLNERHFFGRYPFPSVAFSEARYEAAGQTGYWRGPVWLGPAWFMLSTLQKYRDLLDVGSQEKAELARQNILRMVLDNGLHENYNSQTGRAGVWSREHQSWTASAVIEIAKRQYR